MKKLLIILVVILSTGWFWYHTLSVKDLRGVWVAETGTEVNYQLTFWSNGDLEVKVYRPTGYQFPNNPTFKLGWRVTRGGSLVLIFSPEYTLRVSRFFGISFKEIQKGLQGNQVFFARERNAIYTKGRKIGEVQLLNIQPLIGLKYRFENDHSYPHGTRLMIGKRVFSQTWSGVGF